MVKRTLTDEQRIAMLREAREAGQGWPEAVKLWSVCADLDWLLARAAAAQDARAKLLRMAEAARDDSTANVAYTAFREAAQVLDDFDTPPDDRDREPGTLFDVEWWQRNLSARNGSDRAMAEFVVQTLDFAWPFVSTLRHLDDRDREVERIAAVLHEFHGGPAPWPRAMTSEHFAAALYDAGLRASGGN